MSEMGLNGGQFHGNYFAEAQENEKMACQVRRITYFYRLHGGFPLGIKWA